MNNIEIRMATQDDAKEILTIYAPYISDTVITFEYEIPSLDNFKERIRSINSDYPYLVCLIDGKIVGYAYAQRFKERAAYAWNAELSVYIKENNTKLGIGTALYSALIDILKLQNIENVYGCVTYPNVRSEKLHQYFGFELVARIHKAGYKCNNWHDVVWFEKIIGSHDDSPKIIKLINQIDKQKIQHILENKSALIKGILNENIC